MLGELFGLFGSALGGGTIARRIDDRRKKRARSEGYVLCAVRDLQGAQPALSSKWRRGRAAVLKGCIEFDGYTIAVDTVDRAGDRKPTPRDIMSISPDFLILRLGNAAGDYEMALFPQDVEWFAAEIAPE